MKSTLLKLLIFISPLIFVGCNGEVKISKLNSTTGSGTNTSNVGSPMIFNGITSIDLKTDSTLRINWIPHGDAIAYDVFDATSSTLIWLKTVVGQSSSSAIITGLSPSATYKFIARAKDSSWINEANTNKVSAIMNSAPDAPSSVALVSPTSPGYSVNPIIRVGGVKASDVVKLYSDSSCTTQVAVGTANGATIDLTTSNLSVGTYAFYATAVNAANVASSCSTASASYQIIALSMPSVLALITPTASPSFSQTPTIRVSGVTNGHVVKLFTDSSCTAEVASGTALGATLDLTTSVLLPGAYTLYARAINGTTSSPCSTANVSYTVMAAFAGVSTIDLKTDSTLRINWIPHADAIAYDVFDATSSTLIWLKTAVGQSSSSAIITGLTPSATYKFIARAKDSSWINEANNNKVSATMNSAPDAPSSVALVSPSSPSYSVNPIIRVGGVKADDVVKLYSDSSCTAQVALGTANGTTIDLTTSNLSVGTYAFYATAVNAANVASPCSTASASYQVISPSMPSALALVTPTASPSFSQTPTIRVSGVTNGHVVKLFTDSSCTAEVASGTALAATTDLTTSVLSPGTYTIYARAVNGTSSPCSTANVSYTVMAAFAGVSTTDLKTDSTLRINWSTHATATSYEIYRTSPGITYLSTINAPGTSYSISGLTPSATYSFMVKAKDSQGVLDWNTVNASVTMNAAPDIPSALALVTPAVSPGVSATPTIRVSGVKSGDTVKLYSDNTCATEVASSVASGSTINLTTSTLSTGSYTFYAKAINSVPTSSACSTASVSYTKGSCPAGYIPVPANTTLGTTAEFCVMKFEAKNVGSVATSQALLGPWGAVDASTARTACTSLGVKYDIISNPEWMTIAYEIEKTAANWTGGIVGTGSLTRGHTDNSPNSALAVSNTSDPYIGTGNSASDPLGSGKEQKRLHTLSNGETIWDFSGNVGEWVDWTIGGTFTPGPTSCLASNTELVDVSCGALAAIDYMPGNPGGISPASYRNTTYRMGQFFGGTTGYTVRSGAYSTGVAAGIFDVNFSVPSNNTVADIGFRCVYRP
jgi:hypothetical protein